MKFIISILCSAALVVAHGYVDTGTIGGKNYQFYQAIKDPTFANPYQDPYQNPGPERISRKIAGNGPVEDVNSIDMQCGTNGNAGSSPAKLHAPATAGSSVNLRWTVWPDSHVGPAITYMARCPDSGCNNWQPGRDAVWFKVHEAGRSGTSNTWASTPLMKAGNSGYDYTIPSCLRPGYYLVRHELIALHSAGSYPGAQFYPGCHQLQVTGSGNTVPTSGLVAFPGAYRSTDPGVTYNAYTAQPFTIPGPAVFRC